MYEGATIAAQLLGKKPQCFYNLELKAIVKVLADESIKNIRNVKVFTDWVEAMLNINPKNCVYIAKAPVKFPPFCGQIVNSIWSTV